MIQNEQKWMIAIECKNIIGIILLSLFIIFKIKNINSIWIFTKVFSN